MTTHASVTVHPDHSEVRAIDLTANRIANGGEPGSTDLVSLGVGDGDINIALLGTLDDLERWVAVAGAQLGQVRFARRLTTEECAGGGAHTLSPVEHTDLGEVLECTGPGCGGKFIQAAGQLCPVIPDVDGYIRPTAAVAS